MVHGRLGTAAWGLAMLLLSACGSLSTRAAAACDLDVLSVALDASNDVVVCTDEPVAGSRIEVTDNLELIYRQPLKRCGVDDKRPGLHLVLSGLGEGQAALTVRDATDGTVACSAELNVVDRPPQPKPPWLNTLPEASAKFVDAGGIRTRYFERGSGQPIVLVHGGQAGGANNSAQKWEQNFPGLAQTHRVIALDRLAQAGTDNLPDAAAYADYFARDAQHFQDFLLALDLKDVILVGHSQGGWPVTRAALDLPERVSCVVNVDTMMVPNNPRLMREAMGFLLYSSRMVDPPEGPTVHSARRGMALRYPTGRNITAAKAERIVAQYQSPKTAQARAHMLEQRMTPLHRSFQALKAQADTDIASGKLEAKSVVVWGELDPQVPLGLGEIFQAQLESAGVDSVLEVMPGLGHAPFIEAPDEFNARVLRGCQ